MLALLVPGVLMGAGSASAPAPIVATLPTLGAGT
jgi:hypothetical protein